MGLFWAKFHCCLHIMEVYGACRARTKEVCGISQGQCCWHSRIKPLLDHPRSMCGEFAHLSWRNIHPSVLTQLRVMRAYAEITSSESCNVEDCRDLPPREEQIWTNVRRHIWCRLHFCMPWCWEKLVQQDRGTALQQPLVRSHDQRRSVCLPWSPSVLPCQ